ncbi:hypothetical protein [Alicyclobacillus hesperidum]|uniref:hypothetical protein n=1 Tax=Alicyclobacillus hesperidum TaxID=89784 RepID=UPI00071915CE|nr:hypothetical protein [Alicyclobacillus hesperidum]KRW92042.1 hypothetical protein SD51_06060 [Alicyclobacillus tengchongensis]
MNYGFPDWMFAAIAIAAYELAAWLHQRLGVPWIMWVGYGVVALCVLVVAIRWVVRRIRQQQRPPEQEEDDWRNY